MKNPFKRKTKKVKLSEGDKFLGGLSDAVRYNQNKEEYEKHFLAVVNKAEELDNSKTLFNLKKIIEDNKKMDKIHSSQEQIKYKYGNIDFLLGQAETSSSSKVEPIFSKNPSKFKLWFNKLKSNLKNSWEITKEFGREIQYWFIAEYKIFTKLSYALNRKKDEINVRKAFKNNKSMFINKYGYDKGTHRFNDFSTSINNGVRMHKRMEKLGM